MPYQASLKDLLSLVDFLKNAYADAIPQPLSFIALLEEITMQVRSNPHSNKITKVLLGACVFELETIRHAFSYLLPEERDEMYRLLNGKLKVSVDNPLKNDERLYYITQFFEFVEKHLQEQSIQKMNQGVLQPVWNNKAELLKDIHDTRKLLYQKNSDLIEKIVKATPELIVLQIQTENFINAHENVNKNADNRIIWIKYPKNAEREKQLNFIRTLHQSCSHYFSLTQQNISLIKKTEMEARQGLLLFGMMEVEKEPKYRFISPEGGRFNNGSDLFKGMLSVLHNLKNYHASERINWLHVLLEHTNNLKNDKVYYGEIVTEWQSEGFVFEKELEVFQNKINHHIKTLEKEDLEPPMKEWAIAKFIGYGTKYILQKTVDSGASRLAVNISVTAIAATIGASCGSLLSFAFTYTLVNAAISKTSDYVIDTLSSEVGKKTAGFISAYAFPPSKNKFEELRNGMTQLEDKAFCRFINTLLKLPDDTVSEAEKKHIRMVLPIDKDDKLHPLSRNDLVISQKAASAVTFFSPTNNLTPSVLEDYQPNTNNNIVNKNQAEETLTRSVRFGKVVLN